MSPSCDAHSTTTKPNCYCSQQQTQLRALLCKGTVIVDFRRVRKIAKSDYQLRHVRPSVRMEQFRSHWTDFHEI